MRVFRTLAYSITLAALTALAVPALADSDPTIEQIHAAAASGQLAQAQAMIGQVLRDHPGSGKAHYVAAELAARGGNLALAQQEFAAAERLDPGLPFARPESVQALQRQLEPRGGMIQPVQRSHSSWGGVLLLLSVIAIVATLWAMRRRRAAAYAPAYAGPGAAGPGMPLGVGAPMYPGPGPVYPGYGGYGYPGPMAGGSGMLGGLASGLAVGAGLAAGEELVHHVFDSNGSPVGGGGVIPSADAANWVDSSVNGDMGGADFGISDAGSWNDTGSSGGFDDLGGGGDWN